MPIEPLSVAREVTAERLNDIVNHPDVRPWVGGTGPLDLTPIVANPANVLLMREGGGLLFIRLDAGLYEVHTQFVPEVRGELALQATKDALLWMFTRTDCIEIVTKVPDGNVAAKALVRSIKGTLQFHRPNAWLGPDGLIGVSYYGLSLGEWVRSEDRLPAVGEWFHEKLAAAKTEAGAAPLHDDDDTHDRYVGAAVEMIAAGQVTKGIGFYDRWAVFAGYVPIRQIAENPVLIDIGDAVLAVRDNDFDVLLCR